RRGGSDLLLPVPPRARRQAPLLRVHQPQLHAPRGKRDRRPRQALDRGGAGRPGLGGRALQLRGGRVPRGLRVRADDAARPPLSLRPDRREDRRPDSRTPFFFGAPPPRPLPPRGGGLLYPQWGGGAWNPQQRAGDAITP